MQVSATRHSSRISMRLTASLESFGTGSGVLAVVTGTGGVSGGSICDESGNAATTIDSGSPEPAVVSAAVPITGSVAVATSALATATLAIAALPIAVACGATASSASAATDGARRCFAGTGPAISKSARTNTANEDT